MVAHPHFLKPLALISDAHLFEHLLELLPVFSDKFQINFVYDVHLLWNCQLISAQNEDLVVSLVNFENCEFVEVLDGFEAVVDLGFCFL